MAMIAMTTSSSIKVKPLRLAECPGGRIHGVFTVPLGSGVRQTLLRSQSEARVFVAGATIGTCPEMSALRSGGLIDFRGLSEIH